MYKLLNTFTWFLFRHFVRPIELQAQEFLKWKGERCNVNKDREFVAIFLANINKRTIEDITDRDVKDFAKYVLATRTKFAEMEALKAIRCFLRYHKARKVGCINPKDFAVDNHGR